MIKYIPLLALCSCVMDFPVQPGVYYVSYTRLGNNCTPPSNNLIRDGEEHGRYIKWVVSYTEDGSWLIRRPGYNDTEFLIVGYEQNQEVYFSDTKHGLDEETLVGFDIGISGDKHLQGTIQIYESNIQNNVVGCIAGYDVQGDLADTE